MAVYKPNKITLAQLVELQKISGEEDIVLIQRWFTLNERENDGLTLIPSLAKSQHDRIEAQMRQFQSWAPNISFEQYYEIYGKKNGAKLVQMTLYFLAYGYVYEKDIEWAREALPNIEASIMFYPMIEWLEEHEGIYFKNRKKEDKK